MNIENSEHQVVSFDNFGRFVIVDQKLLDLVSAGAANGSQAPVQCGDNCHCIENNVAGCGGGGGGGPVIIPLPM